MRQEKEQLYQQALSEIREILDEDLDLMGQMCAVVGVLHNTMDHFDWTGFYRRISGDMLEIGPFQGGVPCHRIPLSRGVCGASAREQRTIVVDDVDTFDGYIACDSKTRSEIVIPMTYEGKVIAVLDVDSDNRAAFDETDAVFLEKAVEAISVETRQTDSLWGAGHHST